MGEADVFENPESRILPECEGSAYKVTKPVDRADGRFLEGRYKESARQMSRVMFDIVDLRELFDRNREGSRQRAFEISNLSQVSNSVLKEFTSWPTAKHVGHLA